MDNGIGMTGEDFVWPEQEFRSQHEVRVISVRSTLAICVRIAPIVRDSEH